MNQDIQLIYPTVELFLYDLREGLGQDEDEIRRNRLTFWQKVYGNSQYNFSGKKLDRELLEKLAAAEKPEASFVQLLGSQQVESFESGLDGYYYPLQLGDTYALHVDYSGSYADKQKTPNDAPQNIEVLKQRQADILSHIGGEQTKGTIGQTWMIWGQLAQNYPDSLEAIAQKCYNQFYPNSDWNQVFSETGKGEFLGATAFELWQFSPSSNETKHLLIFLFPHDRNIADIRKNFTKIYVDLIRLFCYRNKTIWAYNQSKEPKAALKTNSLAIQQTIGSIAKPDRVQLQQLEQTLDNNLDLIAQYATNLRNINAQGSTIQTNIENYQKRLKQLETKNPSSNLKFLAEFRDFATERYQKQIEADNANLSLGLTLLENLHRTIEGKTNIRRTMSDRNLNHTIAAAGIGLATSQIAAAVMVAQPPLKNQAGIFWGSLGIGLGWSVIVWVILRQFRR